MSYIIIYMEGDIKKLSENKKLNGLKRNTIDKFYTNADIAKLCIDKIRENIEITNDDIIIEPSAGNGIFIEPFKTLIDYGKCIFLDIQPDNPNIITADYLQYDYNNLVIMRENSKIRKIHIIGNPPYGLQSSHAIKFIKRSCIFCDTISFILPKSFKKQSFQKHFPPLFHRIYEMDLPENSFNLRGKIYNVETTFQIWIKKDTERPKDIKPIPSAYKFVKKTDLPDISVRRVGVNAGDIDYGDNLTRKSPQSHYFIRFLNGDSIEKNISILKNIKFIHNNTVGPRSISKPELIMEFNKFL